MRVESGIILFNITYVLIHASHVSYDQIYTIICFLINTIKGAL